MPNQKEVSQNNFKKDFSLLVILMGSLGDVARGLCITHYIKSKYPECKITWLIENSLKDLPRLDKNIDDIIIFKKKDKLKAFLDTKKELKNRKFDITLDMQRILKSGILSWFSGSKIRVGFSIKDSKEFNFLFNNKYISYFDKNTPKINQYVDFLKYLNIFLQDDEKDNLIFSYTKNVRLKDEFAKIFDGEKNVIGLVLASQWASKDWNIKNYVSLIKSLENQGFYFVLIGTKSQQNLANFIKENVLDKEKIFDLCGKTTLEDLIAIFKNLKLGIGPDSGAGHLFASIGTPYISLFGPTIPNRVCPYKMKDYVIQLNLPCIPCYKKKCPLGTNECMEKISVNMVLNLVNDILKRAK